MTSCDSTTPSTTQDAASAKFSATPPTGKPPTASALWGDATRSLSKRRTIHFHDWFGSDTGSSAGSPIVLDYDVTLDGSRMHGTENHEAAAAQSEHLVVDTQHYEKYSEAMLRSLAGHDRDAQNDLVSRVDGRWVELGVEKPGDGPVRMVTHLLGPKHPAVTAFAAKGTTVTATTFAGRSAWKIRSADGRQRVWIGADTSRDILRVESAATSSRDTSETIELSRFDVPFTAEKPHDPVPHSDIDEAMNASWAKR